MPTYEFVCPEGHEFSRFYRKISDGVAELPCPECGQAATRKISGGAGLLFKGSGFYITDYGKDGKKGAPVAKTGESAAGDGKASGAGGGDAASSSAGKSEASSGGGKSSESSANGSAAPAKKSPPSE